MPGFTMTSKDRSRDLPAILGAAGSLLLSAVAVARASAVNNDGARYLAAAEAWLHSGLEGALHIYPWPFYSVLVGVLSHLTGSTLSAAHLLDAALLAITSAAFVLLVREIGGDRRLEWLAAALVLTHPAITLLRAVVARDFGMWAFALVGLVALLRFQRTGSLRHAAVWAACGTAAMLFRPESVVVWTVAGLAPLLEAELPPRERARRLALLTPFPIAAVAFILVAVRIAPLIAVAVPTPPVVAAAAGVGFQSASRALAAAFPYPHGREYAPYILLWGLTLVPPVKLVRAIGLGQAGLVAGGLVARPGDATARRTLWLAAAGAALPLVVLLPTRLFLETRYTVLCSLILLVFAPFGAVFLFERRPYARLAATAAAVLVAATWIRGLAVPSEPRAHLVAAGQWLAENAPVSARVHTNSPQVAYYSRRPVDWNEVESSLLGAPIPLDSPRADYLALVVRARSGAMAEPAKGPVASFGDRSGEQVLIYRGQATAP
jgi:hypothetical protein